HDTLSGVYFSEGNIDAAEKEIREVIRLSPGHPDAHYNLAQVYEHRNEPQKALEEYQAEIRYNPTNNKAYNDLSVLLIGEKQYSAAVPVLRELIRIQPDNFAGCYMLAESLMQTGGDPQEALMLARRSVQINPQFQRGYALIEEIQRQTGVSKTGSLP